MIMTIDKYLTELRNKHDIIVAVDNDKMKVTGSKEALNEDVLAEIRSRKAEILEFFRSNVKGQTANSIPVCMEKTAYSLSSAQKRMFYTWMIDKRSLAYNLPQLVRISGKLDAARFENVLQQLIDHHEAFRTSFQMNQENPVQVIHQDVPFMLQHFKTNEATEENIINQFIQPFDLGVAPLLRAAIISQSANEHILVLDMHHIIADGISQAVLLKDFALLYNGGKKEQTRLRYRDYSEWQQSPRRQEALALQKDFWIQQFSEKIETPDLPYDFKRPLQRSFHGGAYRFSLSDTETGGLKRLAQEQGMSVYMLLLALYNILLSKVSGSDDIVVGTSTTGRGSPALAEIVGVFVNLVALRNRPKGDQYFLEFLSEVKLNTIASFKHQDFQYDDLVDALHLHGTSSRNPLFDVMFDFNHLDRRLPEIDGLILHPYDYVSPVSKFDLTLSGVETENGLSFCLEYASDLFTQTTMARLANYFLRIISSVLQDRSLCISDINILEEEEKIALLEKGRGQTIDLTGIPTVLSLIKKQADYAGGAVAISEGDRKMTYAELADASDKLALYLRYQGGVQPGAKIGLLLPRSQELIIAILAVMKAGAVYVPLDVSAPSSRLQDILQQAGCYGALTMDSARGIEPNLGIYRLDLKTEHESIYTGKYQDESLPDVSSSDLAYIIYTSGSTGTPKGVMISHGALLNYIEWAGHCYLTNGRGSFALYSSISFDLTVTSIFTPLTTGNSMFIYGEEEPSMLLKKVLEEKKADIIKLTPSHLKMLVGTGQLLKGYDGLHLTFIVGGEQLDQDLAQEIYDQLDGRVDIFNEYGPTEATVGCMIYRFDPRDKYPAVPIGKAIQNTILLILDKWHQPVPDGVEGELYILGTGIATGYAGDKEQTEQRFLKNPFGEGIMYKTGDRAVRLNDGRMLYRGRLDEQLKIRGYRIEPGEIAAQLKCFRTVSDAAVIGLKKENDIRLVAYYTAEHHIAPEILTAWLADRVPAYMIPSYYVQIPSVPLTLNGKLDLKLLPEPETYAHEFVEAAGPEESLLANVWSKVLGDEKIGVTDDFFFAGGDSIKAIQICARLLEHGYDVSVGDLFKHRTIRELAAILVKNEAPVYERPLVKETALTPIQQWFFGLPSVSKHQFNQSMLLRFHEYVSLDTIQGIFSTLVSHHDALRMVFPERNERIAYTNDLTSLPVDVFEEDSEWENNFVLHAGRLQSGIDIANGPLIKIGVFYGRQETRLLVIIHHLVVDGVSWRILLEDINLLYGNFRKGIPTELPLKTTPFQRWADCLNEYREGPVHKHAMTYWNRMLKTNGGRPVRDREDGAGTFKNLATVSFHLEKASTQQLLTDVHTPFNTQINDLLLTGFLLALKDTQQQSCIKLDLESHGRERISAGINFSRTVGWFTSFYPVILQWQDGPLANIIRNVKEVLRGMPSNGLDYLLHRYSGAHDAPASEPAGISFNYLGQFDTDVRNLSFEILDESKGEEVAAESSLLYDWMVTCQIVNGSLSMHLGFSPEQYDQNRIEKLMQAYKTHLVNVIAYCTHYNGRILSPSDLTLHTISLPKLDELQARFDVADVYPLSPMQEGILYHSLLDHESYYSQLLIVTDELIDIDRIRNAADQLVARYDILRTVFLPDHAERPLQVVVRNRTINFAYTDARQACKNDGESKTIDAWRQTDRAEVSVFDGNNLLRLRVIRLTDAKHVIMWGHHHLLMDGWCMSILLNEFSALYRTGEKGQRPLLPPVRLFSEYIKWLEERPVDEGYAYWQKYLSGYNKKLQLGKTGKDNEHLFKHHTHLLAVPAGLTRQMSLAAREYKVSLNSFIQCVWSILLAKYNNTTDVVFGAVVSGRPSSLEGVEKMIGLFINTIPVRICFEPTQRIDTLVQQIQTSAIESEPHHYLSLAKIQALYGQGIDLFDHILVFENFPIEKQLLQEMDGNGNPLNGQVSVYERTSYDLTVSIIPGEQLNVRFDYNAARFEPAVISKISTHLVNIISGLSDTGNAKVNQVEMLSLPEGQQLKFDFNVTEQTAGLKGTVMELFGRQVEKQPSSVAVRCEDRCYSYGEIKEMSDRIATRLAEKNGIRKGDFVAVMLDRDEFLISVIFGIMKAGAVYIPVDPLYPDERINAILADAKPCLLITKEEFRHSHLLHNIRYWDLREMLSDLNNYLPREKVSLQGSDLAYIMYTSGSTGVPKGVMITHQGLTNLLDWGQSAYPIGAQDVLLLKTPIVFDVSDWEIFWWACTGASLAILKPGGEKDPVEIADAVRDYHVTVLQFVPSMLQAFLSYFERGQEMANMQSLRLVFASGEALKPACVDLFASTVFSRFGTRLINVYGPTEVTVDASYYECDLSQPAGLLPIGKPISNTRLYILDKMEHLCAIGAEGELCVGGDGLAVGYLNNPDLTGQKFLKTHPATNERIYRTGDLATWLPDGNVLFHGRSDEQVKVRGYRIEPGEIEKHLLSYQDIIAAAVTAREMQNGKALVAYYVASDIIDMEQLRAYLQTKLPDYMVPSYYLQIESMPLTVSGKQDLKALPDPQQDIGTGYTPPANSREMLICDIWSKVLGGQRIGTTDNFFAVGGDSIKAIQISARARRAGFDISVRDIFQRQTVGELALQMKAFNQPVDQAAINGASALTPVQQWFFDSWETARHHFNQSVLLEFDENVNATDLRTIFNRITDHHDALRMVFAEANNEVGRPVYSMEQMDISLEEFDLLQEHDVENTLTQLAARVQSSIKLESGPLMKLGLFHTKNGSRLLIILHHLVVDGVSWRILLEDIDHLFRQVRTGGPLSLPAKTSAFQALPGKLREYMQGDVYAKARAYWVEDGKNGGVITNTGTDVRPKISSLSQMQFELSTQMTRRLLQDSHRAFNTDVNDILLASFMLAANRIYGKQVLRVDLEGHGRDMDIPDADFTRTVGWFTNIYPVTLTANGADLPGFVKHIKETLRKIPNKGFDSLLYRYYDEHTDDLLKKPAEVSFNYLGQFDGDIADLCFRISKTDPGPEASPEADLLYDWSITGEVLEGQLRLRVSYSSAQYEHPQMEAMMLACKEELERIVDFCSNKEQRVLTVSDLHYKGLTEDLLNELQTKYPVANIYALSPMQEGMLYHSVAGENSESYFGQTVCYLEGAPDKGLLERSMNELIKRHDALRTVFLYEGVERNLQVVLREQRLACHYEDLYERGSTSSDIGSFLENYLQADRQAPFDLSRDVLMRLALFRVDSNEAVLVWSHHHILMDGWCMGILVREFMQIYTAMLNNKELLLPAVSPYVRYINWLEEKNQDHARTYWKNYLQEYMTPVSIPGYSTGEGNGQRIIHKLIVDDVKVNALYKAAARNNVTINTIIQLAWAVLLARYADTKDVVFGLVVSGRPAELEDVENMVGLFINTIPVRIRLENEPVSVLLTHIRDAAIRSEEHQYLPLSEVQSLSEPGRELLDHLLIIENFPAPEKMRSGSATPGMFDVTAIDYRMQTNYDLTVKVLPFEEFTIQFDYNPAVFGERRIMSLGESLLELIRQICTDPLQYPDKLSLYSERKLADLKAEFSKDLSLVNDKYTIQERLYDGFQKNSGRTAIDYKGTSHTYRDLHRRVAGIAHRLLELRKEESMRIGVACHDRLNMIASMLGILFAGKSFVPLEPGTAAARLQAMITQAGIRYIITDEIQSGDLPDEVICIDVNGIAGVEELPAVIHTSDDEVYVYYTSGSTGVPKGIKGRNKGLSHFIGWEIEEFNIRASFRFAQFTNPGFDVFLRDTLVPLCVGATICIPREDIIKLEEGIYSWIRRKQINFIHCVPSLFRLFNTANGSAPLEDLRYILLAGEKVLGADILEWFSWAGNNTQLVNIYGPTETTLAKGFYRIQPADAARKYIPLAVIPGAQFLILNSNMHPVPAYSTGEVYIRTPYRSGGYLIREMDHGSFIDNPYNPGAGDLIYKTGDIARYAGNGTIELLGRKDQQIKIRGIRIEPDEIRQAILQYGDIRNAAVVVREDKAGEPVIHAFFVSARAMAEAELKQYLRTVLPEVMIPAALMQLDKIPLNANGKLDRGALPVPPNDRQDVTDVPLNDTEKKLASICCQVLGIEDEPVSFTSGFFEMGGHSIRLFRLLNRIQDAFGVRLSFKEVFLHNSIREISTAIMAASSVSLIPIPKAPQRDLYPASPAQSRLFYQSLLHKDSTVFNISMAMHVLERTDIAKLKFVFTELINRHEILRTNFVLTGSAVMQRISDEPAFAIELLKPSEKESEAIIFHDFIRPFDLSSGPLIRVGLLQRAASQDLLLIDLHHIVADGASLNILMHDFSRLWKGEALDHKGPGYIDYACWLADMPEYTTTQRAYWQGQLEGPLPVIDMPVEEGLGAPHIHAAVKTLLINNREYDEMKRMAVREGVSDFIWLLSVYYLLLHKMTGGSDLIIGADVIGRTRPDLKDVVGTFVNILPLRLRIDPAWSFRQLLSAVRDIVLKGYDNQDFQYDDMVAMTVSERAGSPLVKVHFSFANILENTGSSGIVEPLRFPTRKNEKSEYEFKLEARETRKLMEISFIYQTFFYKGPVVELIMQYFTNIISAVITDADTAIENISVGNAAIAVG